MKALNLEKRKYIIGSIAVLIVIVYIIRLLALQIISEDYKKNADSNAFLKKVQYPARGLITDRKGRLLVYNEPSYNIMVIMNEQHGVDTLELCQTIGISREEYIRRMSEIKDSKKNPGYSRFTPQLFLFQAVLDTSRKASQVQRFLCREARNPPLRHECERTYIRRCRRGLPTRY